MQLRPFQFGYIILHCFSSQNFWSYDTKTNDASSRAEIFSSYSSSLLMLIVSPSQASSYSMVSKIFTSVSAIGLPLLFVVRNILHGMKSVKMCLLMMRKLISLGI